MKLAVSAQTSSCMARVDGALVVAQGSRAAREEIAKVREGIATLTLSVEGQGGGGGVYEGGAERLTTDAA